jgi:hypothetical protein
MHTKVYSLALVLAALTTFSASHAARAQTALGGTEWEADDECIFDFVSFSVDGTAKVIAFYDSSDPNDPNEGKETKLAATWSLDGVKLSMKFPDFPNESLFGTVDDSGIHVTYNWTDSESRAHSDTCLLTRSTN